SVPSDLDLKLDDQTLEFTKLRQQLIYYVAGLAAALLAFVGTIITRDTSPVQHQRSGVTLVGVFGFATVALSVRCLLKQHRSFQLHLRNRTSRITYEQLKPMDQRVWDRV